jgi:hypothetical protein
LLDDSDVLKGVIMPTSVHATLSASAFRNERVV